MSPLLQCQRTTMEEEEDLSRPGYKHNTISAGSEEREEEDSLDEREENKNDGCRHGQS